MVRVKRDTHKRLTRIKGEMAARSGEMPNYDQLVNLALDALNVQLAFDGVFSTAAITNGARTKQPTY